MADPSSEEEGLLREWAPLDTLLQQIPQKANRGIFTHELNLTCVDALSDFIAVGTNLGLVYWYNRKKGDLQRLRCENSASPVTCVKVISTVDYMVAAGNEHGIVTVFQIPKDPPDSLPESMKPKQNKQVERYTIAGLHSSSVTAIEWSLNGMKLFSGDKNGLVVLTEIDFYMHLSKSVELLNEKYEIVQLSYCQQLLLVSTTYRSIVCHREDRWRVSQVGQKERKSLGRLGATFCVGAGKPQELVVYASRPGLRLWLADKNGIVQQTLIYKDTMMREHRHVPLINPAPPHMKQLRNDHTFGPLLVFKENLLVTYSSDMVYVLDPSDIYVVAAVADLRRVQDVSVTKDEIFILEGERSIIRIACLPETLLVRGQDIAGDLDSEPRCGQLSLYEVFLYILGNPKIQAELAENSKKNSIWRHVAAEMARLGFPMGEHAATKCAKLWKSMVTSYKIFKKTKKWNNQSQCPSYIEMLDHVLNPNESFNKDTGILQVISVATDQILSSESQTTRLNRSLCQVDDSQALLNNVSQCMENVEQLDTPEEIASSVYVDALPDDADSETLFYDDEHVTVYPETSKTELSEKLTLSSLSTDVESNHNVYIVVRPFANLSEETDEVEMGLPHFSDEEYISESDEQEYCEEGNSKKHAISPKPQPLRPVPTPAQALMALATRICQEEKERDILRKQNVERKFQALEEAVLRQGEEIQKLSEKATAFLSILMELDSSESD